MTPESVWLIERGQAVNHAPTIWWKGGDTRPIDDWPRCWTEDANEARRFPTRSEALRVATGLGFIALTTERDTATVTEHVFFPQEQVGS